MPRIDESTIMGPHPRGKLRKVWYALDSGTLIGTVAATYGCWTCGTEYPYMRIVNRQSDIVQWRIRCNGVSITECPYCSEYGRKP